MSMVNTSEYNLAIETQRLAKKHGFHVSPNNQQFYLNPVKGLALDLYKVDTVTPVYSSLEKVYAFLDGWETVMYLLKHRCGIDAELIRELMKQQEVMKNLQKP